MAGPPQLLTGIDGLTFLNGVLYYNSVFFNNLYRVPVDASGKAGTPVQIWMDAPVKGTDGMRTPRRQAAPGREWLGQDRHR